MLSLGKGRLARGTRERSKRIAREWRNGGKGIGREKAVGLAG